MAILLPTARSAKECLRYIRKYALQNQDISRITTVHFVIKPLDNDDGTHELHAALFPPDLWKVAKSFWQNTGMGISSRYANMILARLVHGNTLEMTEEPHTSLLVSP